jgi:hypothetical protein
MEPDFTREFIRVVQGSGLTKGELATLYVVTIQTIYNWLSGRTVPTQAFVVEHGIVMNRLLLRMIAHGLLPLKPGRTRQQRDKNVNTILRSALKESQSALL